MTKKLNITRRDFLNGCALSLAAGTSLSPLEILALEKKSGINPPALTGLRGSHAGAYEIAHAVALSGARYGSPKEQTDRTYDLVVVGGGISGLAAAYFFRQRTGAGKRILVLDNHDDFGGHARRNEFNVDGEKLIGYGGSMSIDTPSAYSKVSANLIKDLRIDVCRFYKYFDQQYFSSRGFGPGIYFDARVYGEDRTLPNALGDYLADVDPSTLEETVEAYPISADSKRVLLRLLTEEKDYLAGLRNEEKLEVLRSTSHSEFLRKHAGMTEEVVALMRDRLLGIYGAGWDAWPALEAWRYYEHGTRHLNFDLGDGSDDYDEPYIFHFPDGNASIARALVRDLIPGCVTATTMEELVTARLDYSMLDDPSQPCRLRLNATAVDVRHTSDEKYVDVTYIRNGEPERVRARHVVLACYNTIIPHLCPEVPGVQAEAIRHAVKVPLVYLTVAVRNWRAWADVGFNSLYAPQSPYLHWFGIDFPVSIGSYQFTQDPATPTVVHGSFIPAEPDKGLTDKQQSLAGRRRLLEMSYDDHERLLIGQLEGALKAGDFDPERDIAGITVNRWPHGYAYEYNYLNEPLEYSPENGPHVAGRAQIGRISIANSDASAYAYVNGAIDAADRAVTEQLADGLGI